MTTPNSVEFTFEGDEYEGLKGCRAIITGGKVLITDKSGAILQEDSELEPNSAGSGHKTRETTS
jgi:hypothetical protein